MILKLPSYDATPQEPKITMESTPEAENPGTNAESNGDTGAEKNEPAENEVDEPSKKINVQVQSEDVKKIW